VLLSGNTTVTVTNMPPWQPGSVIDWLATPGAKALPDSDYVLLLDPDMLMLRTFTPEELPLEPGWAMAGKVGRAARLNRLYSP